MGAGRLQPSCKRSWVLYPSEPMMTSSNGDISVLLALCTGNSPVTGEFPLQRPVTRSFDVFFDLFLNKLLSKPSIRRWFETPSRSLLRYCNANQISWRVSLCPAASTLLCTECLSFNFQKTYQYKYIYVCFGRYIYVDECCCPRTVNISNGNFSTKNMSKTIASIQIHGTANVWLW